MLRFKHATKGARTKKILFRTRRVSGQTVITSNQSARNLTGGHSIIGKRPTVVKPRYLLLRKHLCGVPSSEKSGMSA